MINQYKIKAKYRVVIFIIVITILIFNLNEEHNILINDYLTISFVNFKIIFIKPTISRLYSYSTYLDHSYVVYTRKQFNAFVKLMSFLVRTLHLNITLCS